MKLELCCAKDLRRPDMGHVKITKEVMVATNTHILAVLPTELLFDEEQVACIPEEGFLIAAADFKKLREAVSRTIELDGVTIHLRDKKGGLSIIPIATEASVGNYPNWRGIVPPPDTRQAPMSEISLNGELLAKLSQALGSPTLRLQWSAPNRAIYVEPTGEKDNPRHFGIIMPLVDHRS